MKIPRSLICIVAIFSQVAFTRFHGEPTQDSPVAAETKPNELERLRDEYERRRADALQPVTDWYRARLQALGQKLEKEAQAVATERVKLAESFWEDDQPELRRALISHPWIWRSEENSQSVELTFSRDGTVHHIGLQGSWKITGPNEVTVQPSDDGCYHLRFDASLGKFVGDRRGVSGERRDREAATERAKLPESILEDDQPGLRSALISHSWIWRSDDDSEGVALTFSLDGAIQNASMQSTWKISGPNEVTVIPSADAYYHLRFDAALRKFVGDRRGVTGERRDREK